MSRVPVIARLRDGSPVGAWLLKANPAVWDIGTFLASGVNVDRWRLAPSYRCELIKPGHPVVLWVTRGDPEFGPGMWAFGHVTAEPSDDVGDPDDGLWRDRGAQRQVRPYVEVEMSVLSDPVAADEVRAHPDLGGMELFRAPRMGSPVALAPVEYGALVGLVEGRRPPTE